MRTAAKEGSCHVPPCMLPGNKVLYNQRIFSIAIMFQSKMVSISFLDFCTVNGGHTANVIIMHAG